LLDFGVWSDELGRKDLSKERTEKKWEEKKASFHCKIMKRSKVFSMEKRGLA